MQNLNKHTFSNTLIVISIIFTYIWYLHPWFIEEWSINNNYLRSWEYIHFVIQFFTGTFLHWWIMHLLFNSIFIYYFWNLLEDILWKKKFIIFFVLAVIFNSILLSYFSPHSYTIWISGFVLAVITYYTLELKRLGDYEYRWWITAIVINLAIWFYPGVSFYGHMFWVVFWIIFFYFSNDFTKKQLVWMFDENIKRSNTKSINPINSKKNS